MATKFPMSLRQLLPVMDVIGHANKHLAKVSKFLNKYGDMDLFPVKFQVGMGYCVGASVFVCAKHPDMQSVLTS